MSSPGRSPSGVIYGTSFAGALDKAEAHEIFDNILPKYNVTMLDTARIYQGSEAALQAVGAAKKYHITTKALPAQGKKEAILKSAKESFDALQAEKVAVYLLHAPDAGTPIEESLEAIQELYLQGRFEKFGISNFSTDQVIALHKAAKDKGYVLPTVYQSHYNVLIRKNEERLFPTLRSLGISIQAYSPIAGGFLLRSPEDIINAAENLKGGRWDPSTMGGRIYQGIYNKPSLLEYLRKYIKLSEETGLSRLEIAGRWLKYHSELSGENGDVLVSGGRNNKQLLEVLDGLEKGPLDAALVKRLDEMWQEVRDDVTGNN